MPFSTLRSERYCFLPHIFTFPHLDLSSLEINFCIFLVEWSRSFILSAPPPPTGLIVGYVSFPNDSDIYQPYHPFLWIKGSILWALYSVPLAHFQHHIIQITVALYYLGIQDKTLTFFFIIRLSGFLSSKLSVLFINYYHTFYFSFPPSGNIFYVCESISVLYVH